MTELRLIYAFSAPFRILRSMTVSKPAWQTRLEEDGYVVVPGLVSAEDCAEFREEALRWLEKFPHGFKRDDRSTWTAENLPYSVK